MCDLLISFQDYEDDMKETADRASQIIKSQSDQIKRKDQLIAASIKAVGKIRIDESVLFNTDHLGYSVWYDPEKHQYVYRTEEI